MVSDSIVDKIDYYFSDNVDENKFNNLIEKNKLYLNTTYSEKLDNLSWAADENDDYLRKN